MHYVESQPAQRPASLADIAIPIARVTATGNPEADIVNVRATLQALGDPVRGVPVDVVALWHALTDGQRLALIEQGCRWCGGLERRCCCQRDD